MTLGLSRRRPRNRAPRLVGASRATVPTGAFGARFAEVKVDPELGVLRITRIVSVTDGGPSSTRSSLASQLIGGTVGGIGMAAFEETVTDPGSGRAADATLGDYLVAVNADAPDIDVAFVGEPDPTNPIGAKGIGEVGIMGVAAAIANAVYHATGRRIGSLPITISQLLSRSSRTVAERLADDLGARISRCENPGSGVDRQGERGRSVQGPWLLLLEGWQDPYSVPSLEHELGLGLTDDAVHGDVFQHEVAECLCAFDGDVQVEVVLARDVQGL